MSGRENPGGVPDILRATALVAVLSCVLAASFASTPASAAESDTCAFAGNGRRVGCLGDAADCQLLHYFRKGARWFLWEETGPKDLEVPPPHAAAERMQPGSWRIVAWPSRKVEGSAVALDHARTRWKVTDRRGRFVASVRGSRGPQLAMVLLHWGSDVFC